MSVKGKFMGSNMNTALNKLTKYENLVNIKKEMGKWKKF